MTLVSFVDEMEVNSPFRHLAFPSNIYVVHESLIMFQKKTFLVTVHTKALLHVILSLEGRVVRKNRK